MMTSLQKGIEAAKLGLMDEALAHLKDAIIEEPENSNVWVWLAAIIEDEDKQTIFLKKALDIDPENRPAQRGLAYIERKKIIPPKPGEKLSDHTKPIGLFNDEEPASKASTEAAFPEPEVEAVRPETIEESKEPDKKPAKPSKKKVKSSPMGKETLVAPLPAVTPDKKTMWLDVVLYVIILIVFMIIGVLVGSTFLKIDLPFLATPTPMLNVLPPREGIFLFENDAYTEMVTNLGAPQKSDGIPLTQNKAPTVVINSSLVDINTLNIQNINGSGIEFMVKKAAEGIYMVMPYKSLDPGLYCLIHTLNIEKQEALYWCLRIE